MPYEVGNMINSKHLCKICNNNELRVIAMKGKNYQDLTSVICTGCGLVHSYPIPTEDELESYYRKQYRSDYKSAYTPQRKHIVRYSRNATDRLSRLLQFTDNKAKLLDVGSGSGEFLYMAKLSGFDVLGIEPHEGYSTYTRDTFDTPVITSTIDNAEIGEETIDVITLHHVLEHLQNPLAALDNLYRWLKKDGVIMIDVPDIESTLHSPMNRFHYAHIYNFNNETLKAVLKKVGFEVIDHSDNNKGTVLSARKSSKLDNNEIINMPDNYSKLWHILSQKGNAEHLKKKRPVMRFLSKCYRYPKEFIHGIIIWKPRSIVESEFKKWHSDAT